MHCDTLTVCADNGFSVVSCGLQTDIEKLKKSGCAAQCFAVFTEGDGAVSAFEKYIEFFGKNFGRDGILPRVTDAGQLKNILQNGGTGAIFTVENLGFTGGDESYIRKLGAMGVKMASLVWNFENDLALPNLLWDAEGMPVFGRRESRGLKPAGRRVAELLDELKIIIDISHLSDGGAGEILNGRKIPLVASHSNAAEVCNVSRNLTDDLIKKIADCGGVIGVNFCKDFLGLGETFPLVERHLRHLIDVGGEDVVALGSDFDGIPACPGIEDCTALPALFDYLSHNGFGEDVLEKFAYKNFLRVFEEVCG